MGACDEPTEIGRKTVLVSLPFLLPSTITLPRLPPYSAVCGTVQRGRRQVYDWEQVSSETALLSGPVWRVAYNRIYYVTHVYYTRRGLARSYGLLCSPVVFVGPRPRTTQYVLTVVFYRPTMCSSGSWQALVIAVLACSAVCAFASGTYLYIYHFYTRAAIPINCYLVDGFMYRGFPHLVTNRDYVYILSARGV